ncbi:globin-like protein [Lipomyces oligophaga]|uniref:globin-like protein n=1 Tax=Lipomyces oligophaga TaxID=45792 RepID=UPI0034CF16CC
MEQQAYNLVDYDLSPVQTIRRDDLLGLQKLSLNEDLSSYQLLEVTGRTSTSSETSSDSGVDLTDTFSCPSTPELTSYGESVIAISTSPEGSQYAFEHRVLSNVAEEEEATTERKLVGDQRANEKPVRDITFSAEQKRAVRETYSLICGTEESANVFYSQFYQNLFGRDPELEYMFPDMHRQAAAISGIFGSALKMLNDIHVLDDKLEQLGHRHAYLMGIEPDNYSLVGEVLVDTLRDRLGDRFTDAAESAWTTIYQYLAGKMVEAGEEVL